MKCVFCGIVRGDLPATVVYESEHCLAIVPIEPEVDGHLLVIPKKHYQGIVDTPPNELAELMSFVQQSCKNIEQEYGYTGFNLLNASGESAQQSVGHLHCHILPRKEDDGIDAWPVLPGGRNIYAG